MKTKVVAIIGPTALGKSDLAVALALKFNGEIVSADSRQVYKGLDIGTGKITKTEMRGVKHHMLDITSPKKRISVFDYRKQASRAIKEIVNRGKLPIICGGSGFYVEELLFPSALPKVPENKKLRTALSLKSAEELFTILKKMDPQRAKNIDAKNKVRLIRAIEIAKKLGKVPLAQKINSPYENFIILVDAPIFKIKKNIHKRLIKRLNSGMIEEGKKLLNRKLTFNELSSFGLEYKWLARYLKKEVDKKEFIFGLEKDILAFARRQKTWFKKRKIDVVLKDSPKANLNKAVKAIERFLVPLQKE